MRLPVSMGDLPTSREPWDEDITYSGIIRDIKPSASPDKNGNMFFGIKVEVTEPEDRRGQKVTDNYIPVPPEVEGSSTDSERRAAMDVGVRLGRLATAAKINTDDTDDLLGAEIQFTVKNEEYPEGSGQQMPKVLDYMI